MTFIKERTYVAFQCRPIFFSRSLQKRHKNFTYSTEVSWSGLPNIDTVRRTAAEIMFVSILGIVFNLEMIGLETWIAVYTGVQKS